MPTSTWSRNAGRCLWKGLGVLSVMLFLVGVPDAFGQGAGNSTVTGTVVDQGGVVPGAVVTLTETATGVVRTSTSNETGVFRFAALPPGRYSVKVALEGFKPVAVDNFNVDAGALRDLGKLALEPGTITEAVEVTAEVTPVQVNSSARQASVTADQLQNIQMKGRDIYGLLAVIPGVQDSNRLHALEGHGDAGLRSLHRGSEPDYQHGRHDGAGRQGSAPGAVLGTHRRGSPPQSHGQLQLSDSDPL